MEVDSLHKVVFFIYISSRKSFKQRLIWKAVPYIAVPQVAEISISITVLEARPFPQWNIQQSIIKQICYTSILHQNINLYTIVGVGRKKGSVG